MPKLKQELIIISGGQTGVDQAGLEVAHSLGFRTGGMAPRGYRTNVGPNLELKTKYGLIESSSSSYVPRTHYNATSSDMTVWFGGKSSGYWCTLQGCKQALKKMLENPTASNLYDFITEHQIKVLNVAGNRKETNPAAYDQAVQILTEVLTRIKEDASS